MINAKKAKPKHIAGESRYCQSCGKEPNKLFQVTQENQKINQLQYCEECKDTYAKNHLSAILKI